MSSAPPTVHHPQGQFITSCSVRILCCLVSMLCYHSCRHTLAPSSVIILHQRCPILKIPAEHVLLYHSICTSSIICTCGIPSLYVYALNWIPESALNSSLKNTCVSRQLMYAQHAGNVAFCSATSTSCFSTASYRYPEIRNVHGARPLRAHPK